MNDFTPHIHFKLLRGWNYEDFTYRGRQCYCLLELEHCGDGNWWPTLQLGLARTGFRVTIPLQNDEHGPFGIFHPNVLKDEGVRKDIKAALDMLLKQAESEAEEAA